MIPELVLLNKLLTGPRQKCKCFPDISRYPTNLSSGIVTWKSIPKLGICLSCGSTQIRVVCRWVLKFQNKNQNDNRRTVLLDSLIMPYAHTLMRVCSDKKSAHWHNIHVQRSYMYGARQAIISTVRMGQAYSGHMLLWFFQYYQNQRHQRSSGSHIPRSQAVKITFGKFTCSINADALQYIAQQSLSIRYTSFSITGDHLTFVGIWFSIYNKITPFMLTWDKFLFVWYNYILSYAKIFWWLQDSFAT